MSFNTLATVSFGPSKPSLGTVGFTIVSAANAVINARTNTGVVNLGGGWYGAPVNSLADDVNVFIVWDSGETIPVVLADTIIAPPLHMGHVLDVSPWATTTIRDALKAAWSAGYGAEAIVGAILKSFAPDGTTVVRQFTLTIDNTTVPPTITART